MPTKRTKRSRGRAVVTLESLGPDGHFAMYSGWRPGKNLMSSAPAPWDGWSDFLRDWAAIRDDVAARPDDFFGGPVDECFAEFILNRYGPDGPGPLDEVEVNPTHYPAMMPQPKYYWEWCDWRGSRPAEVRRREERAQRQRQINADIARLRREKGYGP